MNKYLETCKLLRLNQEETDNLNKLMTTSENEFIIKKIPSKLQIKRNFRNLIKNIYEYLFKIYVCLCV